MSQKTVGFIGYSESGKTTVISRLIQHFTGRGLRVAAVKHTHHSIAERQSRGDVEKFLEAGASTVVLADDFNAMELNAVEGATSLRRISSYTDALLVVQRLSEELVLVEGFKSSEAWPRIVVNRSGVERLEVAEDSVIGAIDDQKKSSTIPTFSADDVEALARFLDTIAAGPSPASTE